MLSFLLVLLLGAPPAVGPASPLRITSQAFSPRLRKRIALAVVKYDFLAPGTELKVFDGDTEFSAARVADLPLVRGSWYGPDDAGPSGAGESD